MGLNITEIYEIEKHIEYILNKRIENKSEKHLIKGTYKEKGSNKLHTLDEFMAYKLISGDALESYECYISWFNLTIQRIGEKERIAVSAEWIEESTHNKDYTKK